MPRLPACAIPEELRKGAGKAFSDIILPPYRQQMDPLGEHQLLSLLAVLDAGEMGGKELNAALLRLMYHGRRPEAANRIEGRKLPSSLDDGTAHPGRLGSGKMALDAEWVGAWLLALGANPWMGTPEHPGENAAREAVFRGMRDIFVLMMAHPDRPSLDDFSWEETAHGPLLRRLMRQESGDLGLEMLLDAGVDVLTVKDGGAPMLNTASPAVVSLLLARGLLAPQDCQPLLTAWQQETLQKKRKEESLASLCRLLAAHGAEGTKTTLALAYVVRRLEGRANNGVKLLEDELGCVVEVDASLLASRNGKLAGRWPVWAASAAAGLVRFEGVAFPGSTRHADDGWEVLPAVGKGTMSSTLDIEWQPGILAIGWLWFAIEGGQGTAPAPGDDKGREAAWKSWADAFGTHPKSLRTSAMDAAMRIMENHGWMGEQMRGAGDAVERWQKEGGVVPGWMCATLFYRHPDWKAGKWLQDAMNTWGDEETLQFYWHVACGNHDEDRIEWISRSEAGSYAEKLIEKGTPLFARAEDVVRESDPDDVDKERMLSIAARARSLEVGRALDEVQDKPPNPMNRLRM